jgi:hypothetical protein
LLERPGGDQPGQPGTDNDDFHNRYLDFHLYQSLSLFYLNSPNTVTDTIPHKGE